MLDTEKRAYIAITGDTDIFLLPNKLNRHGLISGATGTGKTITLQSLAETCSQMGIPVFAADAKGDLSGVAAVGSNKESITKRIEEYKLKDRGYAFQAFPVQFWDVFAEQGLAVRATVEDMGPLLLGNLLGLNDTQSSVLIVAFTLARDESIELVDLKDVKKLLEYIDTSKEQLAGRYGNIAGSSLGAIQRSLIALEQTGAEKFFGEPALDITDFMQTVYEKGVINILAANKFIQSPAAYTSFLVWLMDKLYTSLPEVGDLDKPKLVFFFDEAHLLFNNAPKVLLDKVEQVVRLIRSKGVGIYFITQSPADIPEAVLGQLGNRIQHALRAYTPKDYKTVKVAAQSFRANPAINTEKAITELATGEALISLLDEKGAPQPVSRAFILPPQGHVGALDQKEQMHLVNASPLYQKYAISENRVTGYETLSERFKNQPTAEERKQQQQREQKAQREKEKLRIVLEKEEINTAKESKKFWQGIVTRVLIPVAKDALKSFLKVGKK